MQLTTLLSSKNVSCFLFKSTQATVGNPALAWSPPRAGTPLAAGTSAKKERTLKTKGSTGDSETQCYGHQWQEGYFQQ